MEGRRREGATVRREGKRREDIVSGYAVSMLPRPLWRKPSILDMDPLDRRLDSQRTIAGFQRAATHSIWRPAASGSPLGLSWLRLLAQAPSILRLREPR